jgi:hypothetical protein
MADGTDTFDLHINQGATYARQFTWFQGCGCFPIGAPLGLPVNLTGFTAAMQFRPFVLSTTILYDATPDIVLGGIFGTIFLTIDAADTESFTWFNGVYDLLMTSAGGQVTRLLQGTVTISSGVTT